jgi:hypothetical protein
VKSGTEIDGEYCYNDARNVVCKRTTTYLMSIENFEVKSNTVIVHRGYTAVKSSLSDEIKL